MRWLAKISFYAKSLFLRKRLDAQLSEEVRTHVEMATEANVAKGMTAEEARYAALREFGNVAGVQEQARDERGWVWLEQFGQDLRYSLRSLGKSPGYTGVVVLTLALGLGVNMALFTWFNAAAFRPLPVLQPEQLVTLQRLNENGSETTTVAYAEFVAYRDHQTAFSGLAASGGLTVELADTGEEPAQLRIETVSTNYFAVFGVPMALGRPLITADETSSRALPVIVLSHRFWQNHFGGDPAVLGRTLRLHGLTEEVLTVVGVTGPEFHGTKPGALAGWVPLLMRPDEAWRTDLKATNYRLTGRLRPGVGREQAEEELMAIANEFLARPRAGPVTTETVSLERASTYINLSMSQLAVLLPMIGMFGAVFLISCANASNLILARTVTRQFEFAVRSALGATRRRLFAQIMTESLILGVLGGLVGWGVAAALLQFAWPWLLDLIPAAREGTAGLHLHADHRVFGFTLAVSILAGLAGGLFPALQVTRRNVDSALKREGSAFGRGVRVSRVRRFLAVAQLALSAALLFTAGLLVHRSLQTQFQDVGFDKSRLLDLEVVVPRTHGPDQVDAARRQMAERVRAVPGVSAVSEMPRFPFASSRTKIAVPVTDQADNRTVEVVHLAVPASYFSTLQLPVIRGRAFAADEIASDRVVVISETAAREFWPGSDPLGRRLDVPASMLGETGTATSGPAGDANVPRTSLTVIGVVPEARIYDTWSGERPVVFLPLASRTTAAPYLLIRTDDAAKLSVAGLLQLGRAVTGIAPRIQTVEEVFASAFLLYRVVAWVAGLLAGLSLIVAVIGLYGVMAFTVNQREKEIGIRMALGATSGRVIRGIVLESLGLVGVGAAVGYGLSLAISIVGRTILFGVDAFDPLAGVVVTVLLAVIGLFACWLPARRAAKVDPMVALRAE